MADDVIKCSNCVAMPLRAVELLALLPPDDAAAMIAKSSITAADDTALWLTAPELDDELMEGKHERVTFRSC